jgi:hypothetical protein
MSFNLTRELGKHLQAPGSIFSAEGIVPMATVGRNLDSTSATTVDNRPVLQLNAFPMTLSPKTYENAHSNVNPNGSFNSLYAFSQLVNPVPSFTEYYSASLNTISSVYNNLLHGAIVRREEKYTESVIASAQQTYDSAHFANMDGIPDSWYPVYATPVDWYETSDLGRFSEITLDLTGKDTDEGPYQVLKSSDNNILANLIISSSGSSVPVDKDTSLKSVKFKYLEVRLNRPWLNFEVLTLDGWFIKGQEAGFFSNGSTDNNKGIMPLITTSMLVAIDVDLAAEWCVKDQQVLDDAKQKGEQITVGPFVTNSDSGSPGELHVIGWISQLVPLAPQIDNG